MSFIFENNQFLHQENAAQREKDDLVQEMKIMQVLASVLPCLPLHTTLPPCTVPTTVTSAPWHPGSSLLIIFLSHYTVLSRAQIAIE